jgi:polar amino acid transport system substrate-binding protein
MKVLAALWLAVLMHTADAQTRPIIIVAENYAPATFIENNQITGFDVDIARAVFDHLGVSYKFELVPWPRAAYMLRNGQADVGLHVSHTDERAEYLHWPKTSVWDADFVFMTTKDIKSKYDIKSYDDTRRYGLSIGITQNNAYYPSFWDAYPSPNRDNQEYNRQLDPASDAATNLRKLAAGRIQLFPFPLLLGKYMASMMKLTNITYFDWILFSKPYANAFSVASTYSSKNYPDIDALMHAYDLELARLKSDPIKYNQFFQHYKVEQ